MGHGKWYLACIAGKMVSPHSHDDSPDERVYGLLDGVTTEEQAITEAQEAWRIVRGAHAEYVKEGKWRPPYDPEIVYKFPLPKSQ